MPVESLFAEQEVYDIITQAPGAHENPFISPAVVAWDWLGFIMVRKKHEPHPFAKTFSSGCHILLPRSQKVLAFCALFLPSRTL